jgi:hypothetical protein
MGLKCSPYIAQAAMENVLSDIEVATFTLMMLVLSPMIRTTMLFCLPLFYGNYVKMAFPLTHFSVNEPSKKLTG